MPEEPTQTQATPNPTPKQSSMSMKRIVLATIVGLIVVGLASAVIFRDQFGDFLKGVPSGPGSSKVTKTSTNSATKSANKDETADWTEYKTDYNFDNVSFKYPKGWYLSKYGDGGHLGYGFVTETSNYQFDKGDYGPPSQYRNRDDYYILSYTVTSSNELPATVKIVSTIKVGESKKDDTVWKGATYNREENISVAGQEAYKYTSTRPTNIDSENNTRTGYFVGVAFQDPSSESSFEHTYHIFEIRYYLTREEEKMRQMLDNTLSTFKFL